MKTLILLGNLIKWFVTILLFLFSIATFLGANYGQTAIMVMVIILLVWWPKYFAEKWNKKLNIVTRITIIAVIFSFNFTLFKSEPKSSIYSSPTGKQELMKLYDKKLESWPKETESLYIETKYGKVHVLRCGTKENPPLVMFHAASMGAHSWAENLDPVIENYCIYAFDNIGEGNKSQLNDATIYPKNGKEIADLYASLLDSLKIASASAFGASNGGFIAQELAYYYPEKVKSLLLFGPMGLTKLTNGSVFMMAVSTMYPLQFLRDAVTNWAIGEEKYCHQKYGDWFDCIMRSTIPSIAKPIPMTTEQKKKIKIPVLLFLGTRDKIVGDPNLAKKTANEYPNIQIELLESGHLVAVEERDYVNKKVSEFLKENALD